MGCHTERLTLIRMRDAWRAVGAAGAGPVTEMLSRIIGEGGGKGRGHGRDSEDTGQETALLPHSGPIITSEETGQGGAVALAG